MDTTIAKTLPKTQNETKEEINTTLEKQINDILPNQTLYIANLNERIKIEGTRIA